MSDTFDKRDFIYGIQVALLSTLNFRSRWRTSPTLLNGTRPFYTADSVLNAPQRSSRALRINDVVGYADLSEWNAQVKQTPISTYS